MIDISVIMPVFNEEKYLHEAIDSILHQTFDRFEFIIIDDASTDNSLAIIQSYADERIVLICNEYNVGNYPSRNKGLEIAVGKYICVMDADDVAYPQRLELQYQYLEACPDLWILGVCREYVLQSILKTLDEFKNLTTGSTMKHIQRGKLKEVFVNLPSQEIMDKFASIADVYREIVLRLQKQNSALKEARDRLLPRLMSEEIEV